MTIHKVLLKVIICFVFIALYTGTGWCKDEHTGHFFMVGKKKVRTTENYRIPVVTLINQDGKRVNLKTLLNSDKPVLLDFIFTTCKTICPLLSVGFADFQDKLGPAGAGSVQMISITIDPEYDTPDVLNEYSKRYDAKAGWEFLTGNRKDIDRVMKAFDAYVLNKMSHRPLTFIRAPARDKWVRILGLMSPSELLNEYNGLLK